MKQHIAKMHPNALRKNSLASNFSSNYISTSLPDECKQSLSMSSGLTPENIDSNTCLSASDALTSGEICNDLLTVTQKHSDSINSSLVSSTKFIPNNEEHLEQSINLNNFTSNSTHIFYTCHLCQRRYTSQSFLSKHIKTYHGIDDMNESAKSDTSYNEISDSSKFSDTNNSEPNQSLLGMPFENNISESFGDYNYIENNQLNASLLHGDSFNVNDSCRNLESYDCNQSNSDLPTYYQHEVPDVKNFLQSDPKEHDIRNLNTTAEIKDDYSDQLLTKDCKINQGLPYPLCSSPNDSVACEQNNNLNSKNVSEIPVNYKQLPRFTCRICLKTYSGKAYFRKHYKTKHNRLVSDKELDAWQNFSDPVKSRGKKSELKKGKKGQLKKEKKSEPENHCSRRLSLEVSKSNYSDINDLLSAEARSNEKVLCKICRKEYSCRGNLKIHMKNVHNYRGLRQRIVEGNKKEVQCHICLKLLQSTSLKLHVQTVHGDGFLSEEQEAFTVSNVAALSAVNYCAENVQLALTNLGDCNFSDKSDLINLSSSNIMGTDANNSIPLNELSENESKILNQNESLSRTNHLSNLKKMTDFGKASLSTSEYNNYFCDDVTAVSNHKTLNGGFNGAASELGFQLKKEADIKAVYDLDLGSKVNNQNRIVDQSDFDEDFSLSDIPTSEDECTNLMESVMLQPQFMGNSTTSDWTLTNNSSLNYENQNFNSFKSNHCLEPISIVTETEKNDFGECLIECKIDELLNSQAKPLSTVANDLNIRQSSTSTAESCKHFEEIEHLSTSIPKISPESESCKHEKIEVSSSSIPENLTESESCKHLEAIGPFSTSIPEALTEFHIVGDQSFIEEMDYVSNLELEEKRSQSLCPTENFKPDLNVCSTESSTDDEFSIPLERLNDVDYPEKINKNLSANAKTSKINSHECRLCRKIFCSMKVLSKHLKIFHNIPLLKKQKSAKQKPDQGEKLSPPLLTQHQIYGLDTLPPSLENSQNSLKKSGFENENKITGVSNEIFKPNDNDSLLDDYINEINCSEYRSLALHSTNPELSCENVGDALAHTSNTTSILKEISVDCKLEPHKKIKRSDTNDIEMSADPESVTINAKNSLELDSQELISICNILDSLRHAAADCNTADSCETERVSRPVFYHDTECVSHPVSYDPATQPVSHTVSKDHEIEPASHSFFNDHKIQPASGPVFNHEIKHASCPVFDYETEHTSHPVSDDQEIKPASRLVSDDKGTELAPHPVSDDQEMEHGSHSVFDDHVNVHQDKTSKAPILPCIIKVLKNEQNAIIYQIDKSKGDDSSSNSVNSESKSSPGFNRYFMKHKNSSNTRTYRKKLNRSPYHSSLYNRQRSLMHRNQRTLFSRRRNISRRPRKKRSKPIVRTFKYPNDVISFLKNNKQPVVLLTRLKEETLSEINLNPGALERENEKQVIVRLKKCDVINIQHPAYSEPTDITELSFSNDRFIPEEAHIDNNNIPIDPVMKFCKNSAVQETTNLAVVLHKLEIDVNSSEMPLNDDFEISTYKSCVQSPILKECRVVLTKLQLPSS